jgi:hypothetical protein
MACFLRTFFRSNEGRKDKMKIDELETAVLALTAQLTEKSEKADLAQKLSQENAVLQQELDRSQSEAESLRAKSSSFRAVASQKVLRWWPRTEEIEAYTICTEDGGSEKGETASTVDEDSKDAESGSDSERRGSENTPGAGSPSNDTTPDSGFDTWEVAGMTGTGKSDPEIVAPVYIPYCEH